MYPVSVVEVRVDQK